MGLQRTIAPANSLLSPAEIRQHLRIDSAAEDAYLLNLLEATTTDAENYCRRAFLSQTWRWTLDRFPMWTLRLPRPPLVSITSITYVDSQGATQTLSSSLYRVTTNGSEGRIEPAWGESWPTIRPVTDAITITFAAGYGASASSVPMPIRQAVLLMIEQQYDAYRGNADQKRADQRQAAIERTLGRYRVKDWALPEN